PSWEGSGVSSPGTFPATNMKNTKNQHYDALVIGGGPAGSAVSAILAEYGHRVLVLEREKFPRYHIGESLIPFTYQPLERLGLIPLMKASGFVKKYSVVFISRSGKASEPFYFFTRYDRNSVAQTWQVLRSEFDLMLMENARKKGATILEEVTVKELLKDNSNSTGVGTAHPHPGTANDENDGDGSSPSLANRRIIGVRAQHKDG